MSCLAYACSERVKSMYAHAGRDRNLDAPFARVAATVGEAFISWSSDPEMIIEKQVLHFPPANRVGQMAVFRPEG
jgi:hypothetical protein